MWLGEWEVLDSGSPCSRRSETVSKFPMRERCGIDSFQEGSFHSLVGAGPLGLGLKVHACACMVRRAARPFPGLWLYLPPG